MNMAWWIVYVVAIARATGLVTTDEITRPVRDAFLRRLDPDKVWHGWIAYMAECPWCVSIWIALFTVPVAYTWGDHWAVQIPALVLVASWFTGATHSLGRN